MHGAPRLGGIVRISITRFGQLLSTSASDSLFEIRYRTRMSGYVLIVRSLTQNHRKHLESCSCQGILQLSLPQPECSCRRFECSCLEVRCGRRSGGWFGTWLLCRRRSLAHVFVPLLEQWIDEGRTDGKICCFREHGTLISSLLEARKNRFEIL